MKFTVTSHGYLKNIGKTPMVNALTVGMCVSCFAETRERKRSSFYMAVGAMVLI